MRHLIIIFAISVIGLTANVVDAYDFYGASISDKDVPSSYMKYGLKGLIGLRPTITEVSYDSPADKAGFKRGDIILSINGKAVKNTTDLGKTSDNRMSVLFFRGIERMTLIIDKSAVEAEKASRVVKEKKATDDERITDNSALPNAADSVLKTEFGKSAPAELAKQKQTTETARPVEERGKIKENANSDKKKHEWDVVGITHLPNLIENVVLGGDRVNVKTNELCTTPHYVELEHCLVKFSNGTVSKLECGNSYDDLVELPDNTVKNVIRMSLRGQCCTGQEKNLNAPVSCGVSY